MNQKEKDNKLNELMAKIKIAEEYDIPADHLYEEKKALEEAEVEAEVAKEEVKEDAPFCGVLMLIKVNKDDLKVEGYIDNIINDIRSNLCDLETL